MNWQRLERWVTISFGVAAGIAVIIQLTKRFAPEVWFLHRLATDVADYLDELGDIGSGVIIVVFLSIMGGSWVMSVFLSGIEKWEEMKAKRKRQEEARKQERERLIEEVRKQERERLIEEVQRQEREKFTAEVRRKEEAVRRQERDAIRLRLEGLGLDADDILPTEEWESYADPLDYG